MWQASGIEFDFTGAIGVEEHDVARPRGAGNTVFQGVDLIVEEVDRWLWIEVKNYVGAGVPPRQRGGQRRRFLAQMRSDVLRDWLRGKFLGTAAFKAFTQNFPDDGREILYVVLIESHETDFALRGAMLTRLRSSLGCPSFFRPRFQVVVLDLRDWNRLFASFPARRIGASPQIAG